MRTATAPRAAASAANRAPWVRAPGSAAYRSPGRTSPDASVTPVTAVRRGVPVAGTPTRSASSASVRARAAVGSPRAGAPTRRRSGSRDSNLPARAGGPAHLGPVRTSRAPDGRRAGRRGTGSRDQAVAVSTNSGRAVPGGDDAVGGERVAQDVGEDRRGDLPALGGAGRAARGRPRRRTAGRRRGRSRRTWSRSRRPRSSRTRGWPAARCRSSRPPGSPRSGRAARCRSGPTTASSM